MKSEFSKGKASCSSPEQSFSWDGCSLLLLEQPCASPLLPAAHRAAWSSLTLLRDEGYSQGMALPCRKCCGSITFVWDCVGRRQSSPDGNTAYIGGEQHPYDLLVVRLCVLLPARLQGGLRRTAAVGVKVLRCVSLCPRQVKGDTVVGGMLWWRQVSFSECAESYMFSWCKELHVVPGWTADEAFCILDCVCLPTLQSVVV